MARANRHHLPGYVWHITHRCHKQEFLLKFARDKKRWVSWLFEAKKRYGLVVLNYTVMSNHIHLLVVDTGKDIIPQSLQLIAGRTAQEFNQRKGRRGAFWEDRYHAVAVEVEKYLIKCLVYIDLNMVRAGVVKHPREWSFSGYNEIQKPPNRYKLIDQRALLEKCCGTGDLEQFRREYRHWVEEALTIEKAQRQPVWTESIAVGNKGFIEATKEKLGFKGKGREVIQSDDFYTLREPEIPYNLSLPLQNDLLSFKNTCSWRIN